jgi:transmembrane sensor
MPQEDGSIITLNTATRVAIAFSPRRRDVQLIEGEAFFDVAKNPSRPFIVEAGGTRVRAVGTSFVVRRLKDQPLQVVVREGVVEVTLDLPEGAPVKLAANMTATAFAATPFNAPQVVTAEASSAEVDRRLAWREGRLEFEGETLQRAADEFARYSDIRIVIDDPGIGRELVTGWFACADPVGFARAAASALDLRAEIGKGEVTLTR